MYVVFSLSSAQRHCPRPTKAHASRQLSAGREERGTAPPRAASLARGAEPLWSYHSTVTVCHTHVIHVTSVVVVAWSPAQGLRAARRGARRLGNRPPCCFSRYARCVARTTFAIVNNIYCIPAYLVWMMALRLVRPLIPTVYWKVEGFMYHWLLAMVSMWSWTAGYQIVETGDEPATCQNRRTLVLANHQSTADVPMLMAAWNPRPGLLPNLMWIMDRVFKFTNFGIVSVLHKDFFIQAGKASRDKSLLELKEHIHQYYVPLGRQFMVLFPEGGFLHKRREVSQRFAEKNNLPKLEYVTIPRSGAMKVIMEEIGPRVDPGASTSGAIENSPPVTAAKKQPKMILETACGERIEWVLDVTIAYPERIPLHLQDVVCGIRPPCSTHIHYRLYPSSAVPADTEGMTQWLYDRFIEKNKMLEEFYRTGKFPYKGELPLIERPVRQDNLRYLILHIFFIASTVLQFKLFSFMWSSFW